MKASTRSDLEQVEQASDDPPPSPQGQTFSISRPYLPRYVGVYTRKDGYTLQRTTDGLTLKAVQRPAAKVTSSKAKFYFVDGNTGGYVSSLWHKEFEYEGIRYVITNTGSPGRYRVSVKDGRGSK